MIATQRSSIRVEKVRKLPPTLGSISSLTISSDMESGGFMGVAVVDGCMAQTLVKAAVGS
jgi:hypothetical protein